MVHPTAEQVFAVLPRFCVDVFGENEAECQFEMDDNFLISLESLPYYDEIDFADVLWRWQQEWGIELPHSEFSEFLCIGIPQAAMTSERWTQEVKPQLTFRRLSQWLADHIEVPSLAPIHIAGRRCGRAGAFVGIAELVERLDPGVPFAPHSRIRDRIGGRRLRQIWARLNLCADGKLPPLDRLYWNPGRVLIAATYALLLMAIALTGADYFAWLCVAFVVFSGAGLLLSCSWDPLPPHIKTFRDLANVMSGIVTAQGSKPGP